MAFIVKPSKSCACLTLSGLRVPSPGLRQLHAKNRACNLRAKDLRSFTRNREQACISHVSHHGQVPTIPRRPKHLQCVAGHPEGHFGCENLRLCGLVHVGEVANGRVYSAATDRSSGVVSDRRVMLNGHYSSKKYPEHLRRIRFKDPESGKTLIFLTNNTTLPALTIAALYKSRWQVELFFKWIKQHLRIKHFLGNSENAVKTQVWCALASYVLIAIVKKELQLDASLYTCLRSCRSRYSRKPSFHAPCRPMSLEPNCQSALRKVCTSDPQLCIQ